MTFNFDEHKLKCYRYCLKVHEYANNLFRTTAYVLVNFRANSSTVVWTCIRLNCIWLVVNISGDVGVIWLGIELWNSVYTITLCVRCVGHEPNYITPIISSSTLLPLYMITISYQHNLTNLIPLYFIIH